MGIRTIAKVLPFVAVAGAAIGLASCKGKKTVENEVGYATNERRNLQRARQQYQNDSIMLANITKADSIATEERLNSFKNFIDENGITPKRSDDWIMPESELLYIFGFDNLEGHKSYIERKAKNILDSLENDVDFVRGKTLEQSKAKYEEAKAAYDKAIQDSTDIAKNEELSKEMDKAMDELAKAMDELAKETLNAPEELAKKMKKIEKEFEKEMREEKIKNFFNQKQVKF